MKLLHILIVLLSFQLVHAQKISSLKWLEGSWQRENTKPGTTAFEIWEWNKKTLTGIGFTLEKSDTVFVERLRIVAKDENLFYVADVAHNPEPTYFKITSVNKTGFTSENPAHDFPKKIEYTLDGNRMVSTISGDGKEIPFIFTKTD